MHRTSLLMCVGALVALAKADDKGHKNLIDLPDGFRLSTPEEHGEGEPFIVHVESGQRAAMADADELAEKTHCADARIQLNAQADRLDGLFAAA